MTTETPKPSLSPYLNLAYIWPFACGPEISNSALATWNMPIPPPHEQEERCQMQVQFLWHPFSCPFLQLHLLAWIKLNLPLNVNFTQLTTIFRYHTFSHMNDHSIERKKISYKNKESLKRTVGKAKNLNEADGRILLTKSSLTPNVV